MMVILLGLSIGIRVEIRRILILRKKIIIILMKNIWKKNSLRSNKQIVLKSLS